MNIGTIVNKLPNGISSKIGRLGLLTQKSSPTVLFGIGVVGVVATVVLASRATLKLEEILEEAEKETWAVEDGVANHPDKYSDIDRKQALLAVRSKTVIKVAKLYAPAAITGLVAIAALTGSHYILSQRNLAITAAYAVLEKGFKGYRDRVISEYGEEADRDLYNGFETQQITEQMADGSKKTRTVKIASEIGDPALTYKRLFDEMSPRWSPEPGYNQFILTAEQNYLNDLLRSRGHVFLNELYGRLGIPHSSAGAVCGWIKGQGDDYIDLGIFRENEYMGMEFLDGNAPGVLINPNVQGIIYDKI
jgi:hypothetical protein